MAISPILLNATIQQTNDVLQNQTRQVEKGNGNYQGDGGKNKKKKSQDGKVITKPEGGFDMKI